MANTKEIKTRMKSVRDTQKITNAMYMIASTKMRKAKAALDKTRPYFRALREEIKRMFRTTMAVESRYFYPADGSHIEEGTYACLVITADKGLAGAYNQNAIKETMRLLETHRDTKLFVVGEYGRHYFERHGIPIERTFLYTAQNPTMQRAREISAILLNMFDTGEIKKLFVVYTDFKNGMTAEAVSARLLPFHRAQFVTSRQERSSASLEFTPSIGAVLDNVILSYISGYIYSALVYSFCSEQNARMNAMKSANQNADKILSELSVEFNRIRQTNITKEITEICSGAKALVKKRNKETVHE